jgi:hypothetical protein
VICVHIKSNLYKLFPDKQGIAVNTFFPQEAMQNLKAGAAFGAQAEQKA